MKKLERFVRNLFDDGFEVLNWWTSQKHAHTSSCWSVQINLNGASEGLFNQSIKLFEARWEWVSFWLLHIHMHFALLEFSSFEICKVCIQKNVFVHRVIGTRKFVLSFFPWQHQDLSILAWGSCGASCFSCCCIVDGDNWCSLPFSFSSLYSAYVAQNWWLLCTLWASIKFVGISFVPSTIDLPIRWRVNHISKGQHYLVPLNIHHQFESFTKLVMKDVQSWLAMPSGVNEAYILLYYEFHYVWECISNDTCLVLVFTECLDLTSAMSCMTMEHRNPQKSHSCWHLKQSHCQATVTQYFLPKLHD